MSKYIHRLTEEAAIEVASKLLPEDRAECVEGHGLDPEQSLLSALEHDSVYFRVPSGDIAGAAGVHVRARYGCYALKPFINASTPLSKKPNGL